MLPTNHCSWSGVVCNTDNQIISLDLSGQTLSGPYPTDMNSLDLMTSLNLSGNNLLGQVPNIICEKSESNALSLVGDAQNCPNPYNATSGEYLDGCCDTVFTA